MTANASRYATADAAGALAAALVGFVLCWWITGLLVGWLADRQLGKAIRADGPAHAAKAGTPTMGGLGMVALVVLAALGLAAWSRTAMPAVLAAGVLAFSALGLTDDLAGLARRSGQRELGVGLTARRMLALQFLVGALTWGAWAATTPAGGGLLARAAFAVVVILAVVGTANGVNLADGLDGLAAGTAAAAFGAFAVVLLLAPTQAAGAAGSAGAVALGILSATACGASMGFLVHNRHPARVFMGNVASMGLGATLALVAVFGGYWWLLPVIGGVFVAEVASDVLQVAWFRATGGRRVFRMAPIHHHFEAGGMAETEVVRRFWMAGAVCGLVGLLAARLGT